MAPIDPRPAKPKPLSERILAPAAKAPVFLAGLAVGSALLAPKLAKKAGLRGARAAFLAGHLAHGSAQSALARAMLGLHVCAAASEGLAGRLARRAGVAAAAGAPPSKWSKILDLSLSAAIELYPIVNALANPGSASIAPAPPTPPINDVPISALLLLGADAHREQAERSLGRIHAWRAKRSQTRAPTQTPRGP